MLTSISSPQPLTIENLDNLGIYLEQFGSTVLFSSTWTVAGTLELPDWDIAIEEIKNSKQIIYDLCIQNIIYNQTCQNWYHRIDNRIRDAIDRIDHIQFFGSSKKRIQKRGWFDAVGHFSKFLFGTMDATDEQEINNNLKELQTQKANTLNFLDKQVSILSENFDLITKPINILKETQENTTFIINKIINNVQKHNEDILQNMLLKELEDKIEITLDNLDTIIRSLNKFIIIYSSLVSYQLPIELISTETLYSIHEQLSKEKHFNNVLLNKEIFFEIADIRWSQLNNIILYKIQFPTEISNYFNVTELIPYPTKSSEIMEIWDIEKSILISSANQYLYTSLLKFGSSCKPLKSFQFSNFFLCNEILLPTLNSKIINSPLKLPLSKKSRLENISSLQINLRRRNSFLFYFSKEEEILSICNGYPTKTAIVGTGICNLNKTCIHSLKNHILRTYGDKITNLSAQKIELNLIIEDLNNITTPTPFVEMKTLNFNSSEDFQKYFKTIKTNFDHLEKIKETKLHQYVSYGSLSLSSTITIIIIIAIIYIFIKNRKNKNTNVIIQNPTPITVLREEVPTLPPKPTFSSSPNLVNLP